MDTEVSATPVPDRARASWSACNPRQCWISGSLRTARCTGGG